MTSKTSADEVARALVDYRAAERAMRSRTQASMRMGASDLQALRYLLKAQQEGRIVTGRELAEHLKMTSASVTAMLDRLGASGHVQRNPHPTDRRGLSITATPGSDEEVRETLGKMHGRMLATARHLDRDRAEIVIRFLTRLTEATSSDSPR